MFFAAKMYLYTERLYKNQINIILINMENYYNQYIKMI